MKITNYLTKTCIESYYESPLIACYDIQVSYVIADSCNGQTEDVNTGNTSGWY